MAEIAPSPGVTLDDLLARFRELNSNPAATADDMFNSVMVRQSTFVTNPSTPITVATLLSTYPPSASNLGLYARVSDLWGSVDDILRCRYDGTNYRWVPQRDTFVGTTAATTGTVPILPLITAPTLRITTGTLTGNLNITPSAVNAYIGQRARVIMPPAITLGLYAVQITGLVGLNIPLLAGTAKDIEYASTGWFQST